MPLMTIIIFRILSFVSLVFKRKSGHIIFIQPVIQNKCLSGIKENGSSAKEQGVSPHITSFSMKTIPQPPRLTVYYPCTTSSHLLKYRDPSEQTDPNPYVILLLRQFWNLLHQQLRGTESGTYRPWCIFQRHLLMEFRHVHSCASDSHRAWLA